MSARKATIEPWACAFENGHHTDAALPARFVHRQAKAAEVSKATSLAVRTSKLPSSG